jgi:hypothetical protein
MTNEIRRVGGENTKDHESLWGKNSKTYSQFTSRFLSRLIAKYPTTRIKTMM